MNVRIPAPLEAAINLYFDVLYTCDLAKFDSVFAPSAQLQTVREGTLVVLSRSEYQNLLASRTPPSKSNSLRDDKVLSHSSIGENCALVKVGALVGDKRFEDYLSLLRIGGSWKIVSKVYMQIE